MKYKNGERPNSFIILAICAIVLTGLQGATTILKAIVDRQPTTTPVMVATPTVKVIPPVDVKGDTAAIYFSYLYSFKGELELNQYHPITVYGETFKACAVEHIGELTILTVNMNDATYRCGHYPQ